MPDLTLLKSNLSRLFAVIVLGLGAALAPAVAEEPAKPAAGAAAPPATMPAEAPAAPPAAPQVAPQKAGAITISLLYLKQDRDTNPPLSLLDLAPADDGIAGAKLGIADNNTTGQFLNQNFKLDVAEGKTVDELIKAANDAIAAGTGFILADLAPADLLKLADALAGKPATIIDVGSADDALREENCRANVLHTPPTRTMLADAVGQYLAFKQWRNWFLMFGPTEEDKALAEAYRRAAKRFGGKIVDEKEFKYEAGSRRADGGFEQVQQQISEFTQRAKEHDVVIVADEGRLFADYVPYRTWTPRPVVGSAGMAATSWHPALELWGGTQFQNRFKRMNNRIMRPLDYDAWIGVRVAGEAAARTKSNDYKVLSDYIHSPTFEVAAFKGVKTTFRNWNGQLRQPIILTTPKLVVSVSPQPGFLHQFTELDTLGMDKPETKCKAYTAAK